MPFVSVDFRERPLLEATNVSITTATLAPEIRIKVKYVRPSENKTGSFGVLPESEEAVERFRSKHGIRTLWDYVRDPGTGMRLKAFRPIELDELKYVEEEQRVQDGDIPLGPLLGASTFRGRLPRHEKARSLVCRAPTAFTNAPASDASANASRADGSSAATKNRSIYGKFAAGSRRPNSTT